MPQKGTTFETFSNGIKHFDYNIPAVVEWKFGEAKLWTFLLLQTNKFKSNKIPQIYSPISLAVGLWNAFATRGWTSQSL